MNIRENTRKCKKKHENTLKCKELRKTCTKTRKRFAKAGDDIRQKYAEIRKNIHKMRRSAGIFAKETWTRNAQKMRKRAQEYKDICKKYAKYTRMRKNAQKNVQIRENTRKLLRVMHFSAPPRIFTYFTSFHLFSRIFARFLMLTRQNVRKFAKRNTQQYATMRKHAQRIRDNCGTFRLLK